MSYCPLLFTNNKQNTMISIISIIVKELRIFQIAYMGSFLNSIWKFAIFLSIDVIIWLTMEKIFIYLILVRRNYFKCVYIVQRKTTFKEVTFFLHMISFFTVKVSKITLVCHSSRKIAFNICVRNQIIYNMVLFNIIKFTLEL